MKYDKQHTKEISFPLGGIGSGSIGLSGNGRLIDWEIFNRPAKGTDGGYTNFYVKAEKSDGVVARGLGGDVLKDLTGQYMREDAHFRGFGYGIVNTGVQGMPHFEDHEFTGEFPFARIDFKSESFPGDVSLHAFNPFIPLNADDSSIPAAFFEVEFNNTQVEEIEYTAVFTLQNPFEGICRKNSDGCVSVLNTVDDKTSTSYGDMTVAVLDGEVFEQEYMYRGKWVDKMATFWHEFSKVGKFSQRHYDNPDKNDACVVGSGIKLKPGESRKIRFILTWNVPNNYNYWLPVKDENDNDVTWKNYYAVLFEDSVASLRYCAENYHRLYNETKMFKDSLFSTTVDPVVMDAVSSTMSVLKSPTVLRLEDGSFWAWEGVMEKKGSCEGTCTHVWTYAYALCFLFPELERSIRNYEFEYSTSDEGRMKFRTGLPLGREITDWFRPCVDGQMGSVIKVYREWKISGDDEWLKSVWKKTKSVLEFAWSSDNPDMWDRDKDGVLEGRQHHTLDMELFGPSSWLESFYLAALKAASVMAEYLGEKDKAEEYSGLFKNGYEWMKNNLFSGRYFLQQVNLNDKAQLEIYDDAECVENYWNDEFGEVKYQIADGCEIDQMCGQWHANICGLGDIFDKEQKITALKNLYKNNYKVSMREFTNPWRLFCVNDEAGAVMCDYPEDVYKPVIPIPYCEETMHGFEYQLAGLLISEGFTEEGMSIIRSVRDRYNGENRNPWNEIECGNNYARSMASFALLPIYAGFEFDLPHGMVGFTPICEGDYKTFWSLGTGWGSFEKTDDKSVISVRMGSLKIKELKLGYLNSVCSVAVDGNEVDFKFENGTVRFDETVITKQIIIK